MRPIEIPDGVTVEIGAGVVSVKGPKGELSQSVSPSMRIEQGEVPPKAGPRGAVPPPLER